MTTSPKNRIIRGTAAQTRTRSTLIDDIRDRDILTPGWIVVRDGSGLAALLDGSLAVGGAS